MMDFRPIVLVIGVLLAALAVSMMIPAAVDAIHGNPDWQVFALSSGLTLFVGVAMALTSRAKNFRFTVRQAFLMTTFSWIALTIFAALPFKFSELGLSFTDAFFEAMSGITTTGSTVITGLDTAPPGILLWRSMLQWLGGIGVVVMAIAVLPMLRVGGMQLFRMESSDSGGEKALPRTAQIASAIGLIYLVLSIVWMIAYWMAGMTGFEAVNHAMTTIATGGFSTSDGSMGHWDSPLIETIGTVGMIVGSLPFLLYLKMVSGSYTALIKDSQVQWFLIIAVGAVVVTSGWLIFHEGMPLFETIRYASFNMISIMTGTGYATTDYNLWGTYAAPAFFYVMFIGGCAGSTTCGIKIFRFQVLYAAANTQLRHLVHPHGIFTPHYNRRPVPDEVITSVLSFFFVFGCCFAFLAVGLGLSGLDYLTAVSSAATAIANVGPGLGPIVGPSGTFQTLPDSAKWMMSAGMLLGRLELFTIIVLFTRTFWKD